MVVLSGLLLVFMLLLVLLFDMMPVLEKKWPDLVCFVCIYVCWGAKKFLKKGVKDNQMRNDRKREDGVCQFRKGRGEITSRWVYIERE